MSRPGVLKAVGVEPRIQSDPAALLAQAEQEPPDCVPQSFGSLPSTSPVKHSLWIQTSSGDSGSADTAANS